MVQKTVNMALKERSIWTQRTVIMALKNGHCGPLEGHFGLKNGQFGLKISTLKERSIFT